MTPDDFVKLHSGQEFRHREEFLKAIADGRCSLVQPVADQAGIEVSPLPCRHYWGIYRHRSRHLQKYNTPHAISLREDCEAFCEEIEATPDAPIRSWNFKCSPLDFLIFENITSTTIVGCLRTVSKLDVSESEWEKLWGTGGTDPSISSG